MPEWNVTERDEGGIETLDFTAVVRRWFNEKR